MYHQFYGLSRAPFSVTPDPGLLYLSAQHREALAMIAHSVASRKGFTVLTGEVGLGKTTVVRAYFEEANSAGLKLINIFTPVMTGPELMRYLCKELGLPPVESDIEALQALQVRLLEMYRANRTVGLILDEAQTLRPETIEYLRLLSNLETNADKLLQIILVGQPELDRLLASRDLRQVNQRIVLRARLKPLSVAESVAYLEYRLMRTGAESLKSVITRRAARAIARASAGIPRQLNVLADNALIAGYSADERPVGVGLARQVIKELAERDYFAHQPRRGLWRWIGG